ncbi:MAG: hypothetical protein P4L50_01760 [Anaerolineaceae bacterium]|nr:hypothetical protein [Alphaproteobacteria bacterium]MDR3572563.1 hypothetical protein [Anaerolineaceae bacterium]
MKVMSKIAKIVAVIFGMFLALSVLRILLILALGTATYESLAGTQLAVSAGHKIDTVLVSHGLCATYKNECPEKDVMGSCGIRYGQKFEIWGISDPTLLMEIAQIITSEWRPTDLRNLEIVAHPYPKTEEKNQTFLSRFDSDYFHLKLRKDKK